jgi:cysteine desulfurase
MPLYLDCASTTPLDPRVRALVLRHLDEDFGNAGSRTHDYGRRARAASERARDQIAAVVGASRSDIIFTSGATESNNLALLGLARHGHETGRRHIVTTAIEHHAVLEPLAVLERRGFQVERILPERNGAVEANAIERALRPDTLLVSVMQVNNETGVIQPTEAIAALLERRDTFLHVDAAQGFGARIPTLRNPRIDLVSISGHKICAPKGIGALVVRRRAGARPPLEPIMFGGGQERGWRPGTLPVPLVVGLGEAAHLALDEAAERERRCREIRRALLDGLAGLQPVFNGDPDLAVPHIVNLSFPGIDAETAIEAWQDLVAVSHGAACTTQAYACSHVLSAMGLTGWQEEGALRLSWCHLTPTPDSRAMAAALERARSTNGSLAP